MKLPLEELHDAGFEMFLQLTTHDQRLAIIRDFVNRPRQNGKEHAMALNYSRDVGQGNQAAIGMRQGNGTDNPPREPGMLLNLRNSLEGLEKRIIELLQHMERLGDRIHGAYTPDTKLSEPMGDRPHGPMAHELNEISERLHLLLGKMTDQFNRLDRL